MLNVVLRRYGYLDDALAAACELKCIGVQPRDVRIFAGESDRAITAFETPCGTYRRSDRHKLMEILTRFGASETDCRTRLWGMREDHALIAVRARLPLDALHAILDRCDSELRYPVFRDFAGWSAISDSQLSARA